MNFNAFGSKPAGYEQIADLSAAAGLPNPPSPTATALLIAEDQDVRWRDDGTDPTAEIGMLLPKGVEFQYQGNLAAIRFIETASGAKLNVSYYFATGGILQP